MDERTYLFGIPVPSTDKVFLAVVVIHILIAIMAVTVGIAAKTSRRHKRFGSLYFWSMTTSFATILILSIMRWPHNIHLLTIGALAF
jgi:hypothetical protein